MSRGIFGHLKEKTDTMSAYLPYESVYYEKIADYYSIIKYAALGVLAVFFVAAVLLFNQDLRAENFRYLFKYIYVDPVSTSSNYKNIYYNSNDKTYFAFYKGDLAVIGDGKIELYNISGNNIFSEQLDMENAVCDSSGKHMVVYYPGENRVSVFNSFSKLHTVSYTKPVVSASAGENGGFSVITSEEGYRSSVYIYNSSFKKIYHWRSNERYAASADISSNKKNALVLTYSHLGGIYVRELSVYGISKNEQLFTVSSEGKMPIKAGFFSDDNFYGLYTDGIEFYSEKFNKLKDISFDEPIQFYKVFSKGVLIITGTNRSDTVIRFYDSDGETKYEFDFMHTVIDVDMADGSIYLLSDAMLYRYDGNMLMCAELLSSANDFFAFDDGNAMVCYDDHTQLVNKSDFVGVSLKGE